MLDCIFEKEVRGLQHGEMVYEIVTNLYRFTQGSLNLDFLRFPEISY